MEENKNLHEKENRQRSIKIHGDWNLYQSIKPNSMDTFQDTFTNEDYARILRNLLADSGDLLLPNEAERIWKGFVDYHSFPNPFDCIENDTELMDGFFG